MLTEFKEFLSPSKVYIPLTDVDYKIANVKVQIDDEVKVGQVLAEKFKGKAKLPVVSSVSGTIIGFEVLEDRYGKKVDHCVIENNKQNSQIELGSYENPSSSQIRTILNDLGIERTNPSGIFTPIKFDKKIDHVVVNTIFGNEPHYSVDYFYLQDHAEEIAKGIEMLAKAALCESITVFVDRRMPAEVLEKFGIAIVDKNVNLVEIDPVNVQGQDQRFIAKLVGKDLKPNLLDSGVLYTDTAATKMVVDAINGIVPSSRQVVITGDGVKSNVVYEVRFGTLLTELVEDLGGYNDVEEMVLHIGDFLTGQQVKSDEIAITATTDGFNFAEYRDVEEDVCIKCGDCNDVCPAGILPQNIMDAELRAVNSRIVELDTNLCTECGLCTYVCPSKINVLEWVRRAKRRVG